MLKFERRFLIYGTLSFANLWLMSFARSEPIPNFMFNRGLTAVVASVLFYRLATGRFSFPISDSMKRRLSWGGLGMALQVFGLATAPPFIYPLVSRATPIWYALFEKQSLPVSLLISLVGIWVLPLGVLGTHTPIILSVSALMLATSLIALSQLSQVKGATLESRWLMPLAPALGSALLGGAWAIFHHEISWSALGMISGLAMTVSYWFAQPLIASGPKGGMKMVLADLSAGVLLGLVDLIRAPSLPKLGLILLSVVIFLGLTKEGAAKRP